jgi:hypothetical protein
MSAQKQIDQLILTAGLENIGSFVSNVLMMFEQELDALKSCAKSNAGITIQCQACGYYLNQGVDGRLAYHLDSSSSDALFWLAFHFDCPRCDKPVRVQIVPFGMAEEVPF